MHLIRKYFQKIEFLHLMDFNFFFLVKAPFSLQFVPDQLFAKILFEVLTMRRIS